MKTILRKISACVFFAAVICFTFVNSYAAEYQDTLRVGIYYGSDTQSSLTLESIKGFDIGFSSDRSFYPLETVGTTSVKALKSYAGTYHLLHSSHSTREELEDSLAELRGAGVNVFPAYYNSSYCAFSGVFTNQNDAQWQADNGGAYAIPVALSANALCLTDNETGNIILVVDHSTAGLAVFSADRQNSDSFLTISGSSKGTYRGGFECKALGSEALTVVNIVPVEDYLYSVVCREMSPSWHVEALKTQAVCARNFALGRINYHNKYGFDVCKTVCCQAYSSTADQSKNVHTAVDETRGELLFYENQLVQAVYSSSMGSSTENVKNVWGSNFPYLVSVDNSYEDTENVYNGKWEKKLTTARATELMKSYGIGTVTDISAIEYSDAGRVVKLRVTGTEGEKIFEREKCRTVFSEATYSQKYTITKGGIITHPSVFLSSYNSSKEKTLDSVSVLSGNNKTETISGKYVATNGKTTKSYSSTVTGGDPDTYTFSGEGWGHGVGMSQYGAKGMAEAGFDYEEILTHYYTGTHLEKAY
ncbi:MAG: SpoIID/LytB domain-containing protein [Ruminococcaceae bacterium]|nr:SpoIID/LytB domain-containing protein [Oscillospiraceae bacterium]